MTLVLAFNCPSPSSYGSDYDCDSDSLNPSSESINSTCASQSTACTSRLGLVYTAQLQQRLPRFCPSCGQPNLSERTQITNVGTMLKVVTECLAGCTFTWHSQETLSAGHVGSVPEGNFALASACHLSGSTYAVLPGSALPLAFVSCASQHTVSTWASIQCHASLTLTISCRRAWLTNWRRGSLWYFVVICTVIVQASMQSMVLILSQMLLLLLAMLFSFNGSCFQFRYGACWIWSSPSIPFEPWCESENDGHR